MTTLSGTVRHLRLRLAERMDSPDAETGMRRACELLIERTRQTKPPIRFSPILRHLDVVLRYDDRPIGKEVASVTFEGGTLGLSVARERFKSHPRRARFSVAHEVAHLIVMRAMGGEALTLGEEDQEAYEEMERLCDAAASHLLLPREHLAAAVSHRGVGRRATRELTDLFEVSSQAMFRAIGELVPGGAVSEWRLHRRHPGEETAWRVVRWHAAPPRRPEPEGRMAAERPWLPVGCTLRHLDVGSLIPDLSPDVATMATGVELNLRSTRTLHDAVLCRWSRGSGGQMRFDEGGNSSAGVSRFRDASDSLIIVLGRRNRLDAGLFAIRDRRS